MTKRQIYQRALIYYGFYTMCHLMQEYEQEYNYEECAIILSAMHLYNEKHEMNLPTRLGSESREFFKKAIEAFGLTGSSIINNIPDYIQEIKHQIKTEVK